MSTPQEITNTKYCSFLMSSDEANRLLAVHSAESGVRVNDGNFTTLLEKFVLGGLDDIADRAVTQYDETGTVNLESLSGDPGFKPLGSQRHALLKALGVSLNGDHLSTVDALALLGRKKSRSSVLRAAAWAATWSVLTDPHMGEKWNNLEASRQRAAATLRERIAAASATSDGRARD